MDNCKSQFLLQPGVVFLNNGSFGACPRPVFEVYQNWQLELERQPVDFMLRQALPALAEARAVLAEFLGVGADDLVYFPNPTTAINMVVRSLSKTLQNITGTPLRPGDEILTTEHEYGALNRTWGFLCSQDGLQYVQRPIPLPVDDPDALVEHIWEGVNPRTRVIFISHITSPTALVFPVEKICQRARQAGILTIVDGAHAPGQIPLDIQATGADIYTGACHKWLMAPKGSAFLYARKEIQPWLDPLVVSWGYQAEAGFGSGNPYIDYHEWQGTHDLSAFLSVPAAIDFYKEHNWDAVADRCHHLARAARRCINALTGLKPVCPETSRWFKQMFTARLPAKIDPDTFGKRLYEEFQIEVPIMRWNQEKLLRVSVQGYNDHADLDALVDALHVLLE